MRPPRLNKGDLIGIVCPCHVAKREQYAPICSALRERGFRVLEGENLYRDTDGYLASVEERAHDINAMARNEEVSMVFFGGGDGAVEVLPHLDYEAIARNPKIYLSYSDGTSILNAIHMATGMTAYYGQMPGLFPEISSYDEAHFQRNIVRGETGMFEKSGPWQRLGGGAAEGSLIGGYATNLALLMNSRYMRPVPGKKYLLFFEDHKMFHAPAEVSTYLSHIEQSDFMRQVTGLIVGHYAEERFPDLIKRLERFAQKNGIPAVYTDDFGHGANHAILPIGAHARLDADRGTLEVLD